MTVLLKILLLVISINKTFSKTHLTNLIQTHQNCGIYICQIVGGNCLNQTVCQCNGNYSTDLNNLNLSPKNLQCSYIKKIQLNAFIFEILFPFGGGHFYSERYLIGSLKLTFSLITYLLIFIIRFLSKDDEEYSVDVITLSAISYLFLMTMIIWQIVDLVFFGFNKYLDGNGIVFRSWNNKY